MLKKLSTCFIFLFLMHTPLWADFKAQDFSAKKIASIPLLKPISEYIFQHQNQIYTIQGDRKVKKWNESEKKWENFNAGLSTETYVLYSDGKNLYAANQSGVFSYNSKTKKWEIVGRFSESLSPHAVSQSGGKLTLISKDYGVYQLDQNKDWKKVPTKNSPPPTFQFWGMSNEMVTVSSGTKIYAYSQVEQDWLDISANIEQEIGSEDKIKDLMVIGETFYIGIANKGIFKRDLLKDKEWSLLNEGIAKNENFQHFSMPHEELTTYSDQNQYKFNAQKTGWIPLNLGFENLGIITLTKKGKEIFAASNSEIFLKDGSKIETINQGLESGDSLITLTKSNTGFLMGTLQGLHRFGNETKKWENLTDLFSPDCTQAVYPILLKNDQIWIGTENGGVYAGKEGQVFSPYQKGIHAIPTTSESPPCPNKAYDLIYRLTVFQNKIYAITPSNVYELTPQKEWKKVFSFPKTVKKSQGSNTVDAEYSESNNQICCVTTTNSKFYLGTMSGLYEFDGKNPWKKIPVAEKPENSPAYHVASTQNWIALQTDSDSVYRYDFNTKNWEFLPGDFGDISKLLVHQNKLFALSNKKIYFWNEEARNWESLDQISASKLMGAKLREENLEKENGKKFHDLISDGNHLYLLASDGIFEISPTENKK